MDKQIKDLIDISHYYGGNKEFVIAGGGNTSFKNDKYLWVKASGINLGTIDEEGLCVLDREKLNRVTGQQFSDDPVKREEEIKNALLNCRKDPGSTLRPSVETSLHNLLDYSYVVHTHSTIVNGLMCSDLAEQRTREIFGEKVLYIPYSNPGYILFSSIAEEVGKYKNRFHSDPKAIFIQNHGVFVAADSVEEIKNIYQGIIAAIKGTFNIFPESEELEVPGKLVDILPAVRMLVSQEKMKVVTAFNTSWIAGCIKDKDTYEKSVSRPFNPDQIMYCSSEYLYIEDNTTSEGLVSVIKEKIDEFRDRRGVFPKVIFIKNAGAVVAEDSVVSAGYLKDMVNDFCMIAGLSENFGGPHPLSGEHIEFIENWEAEKYREKVSLGAGPLGCLEGKTVIVTGAAQGFGAGIAGILFAEGANIVVADLNEEQGIQVADSFNEKDLKNKAVFIKADVADGASVENMIRKTVLCFGGLDILISNAGILHAGSLEDMDQDTFELMTRVNYTGYFLCTKYAQKVMKVQHRYKPDHFMDIIQINSKSGLKGSNKNFTYSGGKFGGIGLTQSFALELIQYHIKVNSICPGNYFDGPLWSDPEKGLFFQYLKTGKVPGAKTVADVRSFYESQVPAGRGCTPEDVAKAIFYVVGQNYETGQAIPVTGGQIMLK